MDQKKLKRLIQRRHPEYEETLRHWNFLEACYNGGREWFAHNIFPYVKEGENEYKDRVERAYRFNHTREIVDLVSKYIFKAESFRNTEDAPDYLTAFWKKSTRNGLPIEQFARQLGNKSSIYGSIWVIVDSRVKSKPATLAEEKELGDNQIFAYTVKPQSVLDFAYDEVGEFEWVLLYEAVRDDDDPFESSGQIKDRYRLWTKTEWMLFEVKNKNVNLVDSGPNELGEVPIVRVDNYISDELYCAPSLIGDIAYLDRAAANYLSNLDAIIQDQTFSQLVIPAQGLLPGKDGYEELIKMGTKRIFTYDGERGNEPKYISPDPKQADVILSVVSKIINEIYHSVGVAGERTKEDNSLGIDNSSGVAKAYDFERVHSLLVSKAASLELAENKINRLVSLWATGKEDEADYVTYPKEFNVRDITEEFAVASNLGLVQAPDEVRREHMKVIIEKLFPRLAEDIKSKMLSELNTWPPDPVEVALAQAKASFQTTKSNQGQAGTKPPTANKSSGKK